MATKPLPDVETLRKLLDYDPETGVLTWKRRSVDCFRDTEGRTAAHACRQWNDRYAGQPAFANIENHGYPRGSIMGRKLLAHRVAWAVVHGEWPKDFIDHINGNRADNRLSNLRVVGRLENMKNQRLNSANTSGRIGVSLFKATGKWHAQIKVNRVPIHLGYFDALEDAVKAREDAERKYGFHANHGN